jgi:hypothetical protein
VTMEFNYLFVKKVKTYWFFFPIIVTQFLKNNFDYFHFWLLGYFHCRTKLKLNLLQHFITIPSISIKTDISRTELYTLY